MATRYQELIEENDWEGETWSFWIPIPGNEKPIAELKSLLDSGEHAHAMGEIASESEVDTLVKHTKGDCSYMSRHQKLRGRLELPATPLPETVDNLYKGGIKTMMKRGKKAGKKRTASN